MITCLDCENELIRIESSFVCKKCNYTTRTESGIIVFNSDSDENSHDYNPSGLDQLFNAEEKHFWFINRKKIIRLIFKKYIPLSSRVIEIGAGTGNVTRMLIENGYNVAVGEIHLKGLKYAQSYGVKECYQFDMLKMPFVSEFDTVGLFDVLEHIEDEKSALINLKKSLKDNGLIVLTVPAYNWLWNRSDAVASHKRRYTIKTLMSSLSNNGFEAIEIKYFFSALIPFLYLRTFLNSDDGSPVKEEEHNKEISKSSGANIFFNILLSIEFFISKIINIPFGGSIIAVARKVS